MRRRFFLAIALLAALVPTTAWAQTDDVVVFLVRHAEKIDDSRDPDLSEEGTERAVLLARMLGDAGITHIHSTDYKRTQETAAPLARALALEIHSYDPRDLPGLASRLRDTPGRHLVVGHSNTTPGAVEALGGDPVSPIDEAEYDRLYIVTPMGDGALSTLVRFGTPFVHPERGASAVYLPGT